MEKTVQNIPFLRLVIALAAGIAIGTYLQPDLNICLALLLTTLVILTILQIKYNYSLTLIFGLAVQLFFIVLGIFVYAKFNKIPDLQENGIFRGVVLESPQEKQNSHKTVIHVDAVLMHGSVIPTNEKVIAYFSKGDTTVKLTAASIILFTNQPQPIKNNNNPYEFDYKTYMARKGIYRQVYLSSESWIKTNQTSNSIVCRAERIRENLLEIYRKQPIDKTELEILSALTLGYKRDLDPETKRVFSSSGASHVLAVSGLHVGIIFLMVNFIFGFLKKQKYGRLLFVLLAVSLLWIYALVTGLSPSVMRAAAMFSIVLTGININRKANIYNSLAASAFFLLLINPNNLFDIGFQLSYSAVFGIVYLQPRLEKLIVVKNKIMRFFWLLLTVSIAAQISTFVITAYYFGQFPTYFWITNLFVIPAVTALIPLGVLLLLVSEWYVLSNVLSLILNSLIKATFYLLSFIENFPGSVIDFTFNQIQLLLMIVILCSLFVFLKKNNLFLLKTALFCMLLFSVYTLTLNISRLNHNELIVYNTTENPGLHLINGRKNFIISEDKILEEDKNYYPAITTKKNMGLNQPVFLVFSDSLVSRNILLENGFIFFEGKSISLQKEISDINSGNPPDFILNPTNTNLNPAIHITKSTIISNKRFFQKNSPKDPRIHYTSLQGAFRKKW